MSIQQIQNELEELFPASVVPINQNWINDAKKAIDEMIRKGISKKTVPMEWNSNDVNWDPVVNWLRTSVEHFQNPTAHYVLLWLITDKIHGFWNRSRDKSLDTEEMIDSLIWAVNTRIGAVDALICAVSPLSGEHIGNLFRNRLLYRLNPKISLLPRNTKLDELKVALERALKIENCPLQLKDITNLMECCKSYNDSIQTARTDQQQHWVTLINDRNIDMDFFSLEPDVFHALMCNIPDKLLGKWESPQSFTAVITCWIDFIVSARVCQITNEYFSRFIISEDGIGASFQY